MGLTKLEIERQIQERLGKVNKSNEGYKIKIIKYNAYNDIIVEIQDKYKAKVHTRFDHFESGNVKNPYHPNKWGGYVGEGKYKHQENGKQTEISKKWHSMLIRCYDDKFHKKHPTYIGCEVYEGWLNFQNFAKWYEENYYEVKDEKMHLDKDVLVKGNKMYSPQTCVFLPNRINNLFLKNNKIRGKYPIGVCYHKRKSGNDCLRVNCSLNTGKGKLLGCFPLNEPFRAFTVYKNFKENYIKQVADEYKDLIPKELYEAMYRYEVEIND